MFEKYGEMFKQFGKSPYAKAMQIGMEAAKPMGPPELIQNQDIVDPEMMALNRMRRY